MHLLDRRTGLLTLAGGQSTGLDVAAINAMRLTVLQAGTAELESAPKRLVVSEEILADRAAADRLASLSLSGMRLIRMRDFYESALRCVMLDGLSEAWFTLDQPLRQRRGHVLFKSATDLVGGLLGSLAVLMIIPILWVAMRLDDGGPVMYRQERVGQRGRPFQIWKFRTMRVDAEQNGPVWAQPSDDRITRVGRLLRRVRLDEMPQFFNVVTGQMSLIGPRPERPKFVATLSRTVPFYERRHMTKPGLTGWATVRFGYGDSITDKWRSHGYDLYYLKHRSIRLDVEIVLRTVWVVLSRRGQ